MTRRLAILGAVALALAGCGGDRGSGTSSSAAATTTTATTTAQTSIEAFFYRGSALVPATVRVPETEAVARAALEALLDGPPAGYDTAVPAGVQVEDVAIDSGGVATARFSRELGDPPRAVQGQIVGTLTQFPTVHGVVIEVGGNAVTLQDGSGEDLAQPATAADYGDLTSDAFIFVRTPVRDSTVSSPVHAAGTANVFEATFQIEVWSSGKLIDTKTVTATSGSGTRGTWSTTLDLPSGDVRLLFFEPSAEDGSHLHPTEVLLHVA